MAGPPSPCVGICTLDKQRVCVGCGRTLDEIAAWPASSDAQREVIVKAAKERRKQRKEPVPTARKA